MSPGDVLALLALAVILAIVISIWVVSRHLGAARQARAQLTTGQEYRTLADEFRRLSEQADSLRDQVDQMQHILKEVE